MSVTALTSLKIIDVIPKVDLRHRIYGRAASRQLKPMSLLVDAVTVHARPPLSGTLRASLHRLHRLSTEATQTRRDLVVLERRRLTTS